MTDQERSAAREAAEKAWLDYTRDGIPTPVHYYFRDRLHAALDAALTKHEADVRQRIAEEMRAANFPFHVQSYTSYTALAHWNAGRDAMLAIVNPPEPPKPLLCKHCGTPISDGATWTMCDLTAEPAAESTR